MTRNFVIACVLVVFLFGIGVVLRNVWLGPESSAQAERALPTPKPSAPKPKLAPAKPQRAVVTALSGLVELRNKTGRGWQPLGLNHELQQDDALRTSKGARAEVAMGEQVHVEVTEQSEVSLAGASDDASQLRLENGRIAARVSGQSESPFQVDVRGNDATASSREGAFSMLRRSDGQVTVATTQGSVDLSGHTRTVRVDAGQQSTVPVNREPTTPRAIPASLFLKVVRVGAARTNRRETELGGSTTPGANLSINGLPVNTDADGRFRTKVALHEGRNSVVVTVEDAMGRSKQQTVAPIEVDTKAPDVGGRVRW